MVPYIKVANAFAGSHMTNHFSDNLVATQSLLWSKGRVITLTKPYSHQLTVEPGPQIFLSVAPSNCRGKGTNKVYPLFYLLT